MNKIILRIMFRTDTGYFEIAVLDSKSTGALGVGHKGGTFPERRYDL
jgi:hypothetical protein